MISRSVLLAMVIMRSAHEGVRVEYDDTSGVASKTQAPVSVKLVLPESLVNAQNLIMTAPSNGGNVPAQYEDGRVWWMMPAGKSGKRVFDLDVGKPGAVFMTAKEKDGKFIFMDGDFPVLCYNFSTVPVPTGKDWLFCRGNMDASDRELRREQYRAGDTKLYVSNQHEKNFADCVRAGNTKTITPIEVAHRSTSVCLLGGICLKLKRKVTWNPNKERFVNDPEADRLLSYEMRGP